MFDIVKISVKSALIAGVVAAMVVVLLVVQIPTVDFTVLRYYIGSVYAFAVHWCPVIERLWSTAVFILGANLAFLAFRAGLFLYRSIMIIFE